mgnify:FL=1|jgi:hypothetical protein
MSTIKGLKVKTTTWTKTKKEFGYPENDNNDGFEFGFEFIEDEDGYMPMDAQWFLSESDMYTFMNKNELKEQVDLSKYLIV